MSSVSAMFVGRSKSEYSLEEFARLLPGCLKKMNFLVEKFQKETEDNDHEWSIEISFKTKEGMTRMKIKLVDGVSSKNNIKVLDVELSYSMYDVLTCMGYYDEDKMEANNRFRFKIPSNVCNRIYYELEEVSELNDVFDFVRYLAECHYEYSDMSFVKSELKKPKLIRHVVRFIEYPHSSTLYIGDRRIMVENVYCRRIELLLKNTIEGCRVVRSNGNLFIIFERRPKQFDLQETLDYVKLPDSDFIDEIYS